MSNLDINLNSDLIRFHDGKGLVAARLRGHDPAEALNLNHSATSKGNSVRVEQVASLLDESALEASLVSKLAASRVPQGIISLQENQVQNVQLLEAVEVAPLQQSACCHPSESSRLHKSNTSSESVSGNRFHFPLKQMFHNVTRRIVPVSGAANGRGHAKRLPGFRIPTFMSLRLNVTKPQLEMSHNVLDAFFASQTVEYQTQSSDTEGFTNAITDFVEVTISCPLPKTASKQLCVTSTSETILTDKTELAETLSSGMESVPSMILPVLQNQKSENEGLTSQEIEMECTGSTGVDPTLLRRGDNKKENSVSHRMMSSKEVTFEGLILDSENEAFPDMGNCLAPVDRYRSSSMKALLVEVPGREETGETIAVGEDEGSQPPSNIPDLCSESPRTRLEKTILESSQVSPHSELREDSKTDKEQFAGIVRVATDRSLEVSDSGDVFDTDADDVLLRIMAELHSGDCEGNSSEGSNPDQGLSIENQSACESVTACLEAPGLRNHPDTHSIVDSDSHGFMKSRATQVGYGILNRNSSYSSNKSTDDSAKKVLRGDSWKRPFVKCAPPINPKTTNPERTPSDSVARHHTTKTGCFLMRSKEVENSNMILLELNEQFSLKQCEFDGSANSSDGSSGSEHGEASALDNEDLEGDAMPLLLPHHHQEGHCSSNQRPQHAVKGLAKGLHEVFQDAPSVDGSEIFMSKPPRSPQEDHLSALPTPSNSAEEKKDDSECGIGLALESEQSFSKMSDRGIESLSQQFFYDEEFTWGFLHEMMTSGLTLLQMQPPESLNSKGWAERTVNMVIEPGTGGDDSPRIQWSSIEIGRINHVTTTSVNLFGIRSIEMIGIRDPSPFFSIVTSDWNVHKFQAGTPDDRDVFVNGLRNVISWFCYHLVTGDCAASLMLLHDENSRDTDALLASSYGMSRITHELLD